MSPYHFTSYCTYTTSLVLVLVLVLESTEIGSLYILESSGMPTGTQNLRGAAQRFI